MVRTVAAAVILSMPLFAAGCAACTPPDLPPEHPANPTATAAPLPARSGTLAIDASMLPAPSPQESEGSME